MAIKKIDIVKDKDGLHLNYTGADKKGKTHKDIPQSALLKPGHLIPVSAGATGFKIESDVASKLFGGCSAGSKIGADIQWPCDPKDDKVRTLMMKIMQQHENPLVSMESKLTDAKMGQGAFTFDKKAGKWTIAHKGKEHDPVIDLMNKIKIKQGVDAKGNPAVVESSSGMSPLDYMNKNYPKGKVPKGFSFPAPKESSHVYLSSLPGGVNCLHVTYKEKDDTLTSTTYTLGDTKIPGFRNLDEKDLQKLTGKVNIGTTSGTGATFIIRPHELAMRELATASKTDPKNNGTAMNFRDAALLIEGLSNHYIRTKKPPPDVAVDLLDLTKQAKHHNEAKALAAKEEVHPDRKAYYDAAPSPQTPVEKPKDKPAPKKDKAKEEIPDHLVHLSHPEDRLIQNGPDGFRQATDSLQKMHDFLNGKDPKNFSVSEKYDGSPSIVTGHHPDTGQFFISTKGFFNKDSKVNFTPEDIDKNYGDKPGLAQKLRNAFLYLQDAVPRKGVFQGDLMYTPDSIKQEGNKIHFTPNTITYTVDKDSPEGRRILDTKMGVVMHTEYKPDPETGKLKASFSIDQSKFTNTGHVNFINPSVNKSGIKYTPDDEKEFAHNMMKAKELSDSMKKTGIYDMAQGQEPLLLAYINNEVRKKKNGTLHGYLSYVESRYKKQMEELKSDKGKDKKKEAMDELVTHIMDNKDGVDNFFKLHTLLSNTKNIFVKVLSNAQGTYKQSINGTPSKPEGFVAVNNGAPLKLVDRMDFSSANFAKNNPVVIQDPTDKPVVFSFGRMNPPTAGHAKLIDAVKQEAKRIGGTAKIVASASHDKEKNPLDPKMHQAWLDKMFPDDKVEVAGDNEKTIFDQLKKLHANGVRHLTVVVGQDRVKSFTDLVNKYNGKPDYYNFRKIDVISAGNRDDNSKDETEQVSGTKTREAAKKGDFETFKKSMPKGAKEEDVRGMYNDVRKGMGVVDIKQHSDQLAKSRDDNRKKMSEITIGPQTKGWVLSIYAKRASSDRIGSQARMEINRRRRLGLWKGK
jgi:hypothetical protein